MPVLNCPPVSLPPYERKPIRTWSILARNFGFCSACACANAGYSSKQKRVPTNDERIGATFLERLRLFRLIAAARNTAAIGAAGAIFFLDRLIQVDADDVGEGRQPCQNVSKL